MSVALNKENFVLHKLHSLTGVIPVGFYMLQHLTLNSFSVAGPAYFDGVIHFFEGIPKHLLLAMEVFAIWIPLLFHSIYGLFITRRARQNFIGTKYGWSQNRMYWLQRVSGIFIFIFLSYHVATTTGAKYLYNNPDLIRYAGMQKALSGYGYGVFVLYALGILASSYHLSYGLWNLCIRWGITISDDAQAKVQQFSLGMFVAVTLLGWAALGGFLIHKTDGQSSPKGETLKAQIGTITRSS